MRSRRPRFLSSSITPAAKLAARLPPPDRARPMNIPSSRSFVPTDRLAWLGGDGVFRLRVFRFGRQFPGRTAQEAKNKRIRQITIRNRTGVGFPIVPSIRIGLWWINFSIIQFLILTHNLKVCSVSFSCRTIKKSPTTPPWFKNPVNNQSI